AGQISTTVPSELSLESCSKCGPALVDLDGTEKAKVVTYVFDALKAGKPHLMYIYNFSRGGSCVMLSSPNPLSQIRTHSPLKSIEVGNPIVFSTISRSIGCWMNRQQASRAASP